MKYINEETLANVDIAAFLATEPFPWLNPANVLTDEGYRTLIDNPLPIEIFEKDYDRPRKGNEKPHKRYRIWHSEDNQDIPAVWHDFVEEIHQAPYRNFVSRLTGAKDFTLRVEWHATLRECPVYPHLDGTSVVLSHLFYLNDPAEWDPAWGGATCILKKKPGTSLDGPFEFEDFESFSGKAVGNYSVLFKNGDDAWHGVEKLEQPEGVFRRICTVFTSVKPAKTSPINRLLAKLRK